MEKNTQNNLDPAGTDGSDEHLTDHSYDGIGELDNPPPRWIMAIFYITIGFSIIYGAYYFWLDVGDDQVTRYEKKSALHDVKYNMVSGENEEMGFLATDEDLQGGKAIFMEMNCFTCHGMNLEGNAIGPNLVDNYAIHGCGFQDMFNVVKNGVPARGMTPFKAQLSDTRIQKVVSYIHSMKGSEPPNAREPQGEICE